MIINLPHFPGYGVLVPSNWFSKLVCCCYAMAGLPLYIIMLGASGYFAFLFNYKYRINKLGLVRARISTFMHLLSINHYFIQIIWLLFLGCLMVWVMRCDDAGMIILLFIHIFIRFLLHEHFLIELCTMVKYSLIGHNFLCQIVAKWRCWNNEVMNRLLKLW